MMMTGILSLVLMTHLFTVASTLPDRAVKRDLDTESFNLLCESECTEFDSEDNCYLAFPDERLCWYYVVCHQEEYDWISYKMLRCELDAIWSEVNSSCVNMTANMTLPDECLERDNDEVQQLAMAITYPCPYQQMPGDPHNFGMIRNGTLEQVGTCGRHFTFNDSDTECTCAGEMEISDCRCKVHIPLSADIEDHGCNHGWVGQLGYPAVVDVGGTGPQDVPYAGLFTGYNPDLLAAPHLISNVIDSTFGGNYAYEVTMSAWFYVDPGYTGGEIGVVTYGNCANGGAIYIHIDNYRVVGQIETIVKQPSGDWQFVQGKLDSNATGVLVEAGVWYYAAIVYNEHFSGNQEELYVFNEAQYENCLLNPDTHCLPADSGTLTGALSPRGCGLFIGGTGVTANIEGYFVGMICGVEVNWGSSLFGCLPQVDP